MKVVYSDLQVADSKCFSPSAEKPRHVVADWQKHFPITIIEPVPVTPEQIAQAHERRWVDQVLACKKANGFGNNDAAVAASLPYTVGCMVTATLEALQSGGAVAAPCSGFHHARYAKADGYCTFNGLIIAALEAQKAGAKRVGILDLDMHYGDGTDYIMQKLGLDFITHYTAGAKFTEPSHADLFFFELPYIMKRFQGCDVLLCQLGADPYILDPFGGWLTIDQLAERDYQVFKTCQAMQLPIAWNLAGGYCKDKDGTIAPVLEIHRNSARACSQVFKVLSTL